MPAPVIYPVPNHYNPQNAASWAYRPDQTKLFTDATAYREHHHVPLTGQGGAANVRLLLIDLQRDFCLPEGSLYVGGRSGTGAIDDNRRIAEFIYRNLGVISNITTTMDTHFAYSIHAASFWVDDAGKPIQPFRTITTKDIRSGSVRPNPAMVSWLVNGNYPALLRQVEYYCDQLEKAGKYELYIWPFHCMLGSDGHTLTGVIHAARMFHSFVRGAQSWCEVKGGNALTENYSVLRPEVLTYYDGSPLAQKNVAFIKTLLDSDVVIIAGQAASHCTKSSIEDLLNEIMASDPSLVKKVYVVRDCMSAVAVPDGKGGFVADFTPQAEAALKKFSDAGMHVVKSTDPISSWPDIRL